MILATGDKLQTVSSEQRFKRFASNGFLSQNELSSHTALNVNLGSQTPPCEALGRGQMPVRSVMRVPGAGGPAPPSLV